jgi:hypothetical protein
MEHAPSMARKSVSVLGMEKASLLKFLAPLPVTLRT